jgi:hypothetical protein
MGSLQGIKGLASGTTIGTVSIFTGSGSPSAVVTALQIGDKYIDYTNGVEYIAGATGTGSWTAFAGLATMATGATIGGTSIFTRAGAANATALRIGDVSVDYTNGVLYMAQATGASDWQRIAVCSTSASPFSLSTTADAIGLGTWWTSAATSGTTYGRKNTLTGTGAGAEYIAGRDRVVLGAIAANAYGTHSSVEVTSTLRVSGLACGLRGNIVFATDTAVTVGNYYGVLAELYPAGNTSALPAGSNACLCCSVTSGTALDLVANAIAFAGADGTGKMIYTATWSSPTFTGSIRILVNGAIRYIPFTSAQAAGS